MWHRSQTLWFSSNFRIYIDSGIVTPRSGGYGDVTVTYIRRSEIPSRIYAKFQYMQNSECESTVVIYIPTEKYKYMVITESDTILQEYYITENIKEYNTWRDIHNKEVLTIQQEGLGCQTWEKLGGRAEMMIQTSAALRSSRKDPLLTLIRYSKATKVWSLGSGHENAGLSDTTLRVHI